MLILKIQKFIDKLLLFDNVNREDINFEYDKNEGMYLIYHNLNNRLIEDIEFSIKFNNLINEIFTIDEITDYDLVGNKAKLKELNDKEIANEYYMSNILETLTNDLKTESFIEKSNPVLLKYGEDNYNSSLEVAA